jgi:hypothetical protein
MVTVYYTWKHAGTSTLPYLTKLLDCDDTSHWGLLVLQAAAETAIITSIISITASMQSAMVAILQLHFPIAITCSSWTIHFVHGAAGERNQKSWHSGHTDMMHAPAVQQSVRMAPLAFSHAGINKPESGQVYSFPKRLVLAKSNVMGHATVMTS